jgi:DNA-binding transcriptional LysR family regulator
LLTAGQLTASLGLDPAPLMDYFLSHRASVDESIVDLAVRHPTGCELLCVGPDTLNGQRLRLMIPVLRRAYDLVALEVPSGDRWLTDVAVETSDVALLIARPTQKSSSVAAAWADRAWERGLEGKLALIVNQADAQPVPTSLTSGLLHMAMVPNDPVVATNDLKGFPWVLRFESRARTALALFAHQLVPDLINREGNRAA